MSDAFTDVAKMKKIKEEIKAHEGQVVEMTLENGRKRQKNRLGKLIEVYPSLFIVEFVIVEFGDVEGDKQVNVYVESFTYSDILTEKNLIHYLD
ncbi:CAAX amino protease family protein [Streptococcus pneumoniae]|nr:CAAX amino protease family protein [Streptococcus pneumoniae]